MKTIACIIARTNSRRLPKKVLKKIRNQQMIELLIERIKKTKNLDEIYLCTSVDSEDKILVDIANKNKIKSYQGSRESVIDRMLDVANIEKADNVVRITGDNLFTDFFYLDEMINEHNKNEFDYTRTEFLSIGVTAEVMRVTALKDCYNNIDPYKSEYLFLYMFNPEKYKCGVLIPPKNQQNEFSSLTIDTPEDWGKTSTGWAEDPEPGAKKASKFTKKEVPVGQTILEQEQLRHKLKQIHQSPCMVAFIH
ncbi:hypothetical protein LCGC14_0630100 [marine sediment metagenome]|uniref:Acylneuraminate cytidylyltransferase n=1 Tax=marine sediment metagenome TaxID=412755 RepID=A0A0F9TNM3_9ZZZZ